MFCNKITKFAFASQLSSQGLTSEKRLFQTL